MTSDHYIEDENLSMAWARAVKAASSPGRKEIGPLIVSVTGFDSAGLFHEDSNIRKELDAVLVSENLQTVNTVANTIFPVSMWNRAAPRSQLFNRYEKIAPRLIKGSSKNRRGIYFERMISGGPDDRKNQLEFALATYGAREGVRRSVLQVSVFDPKLDHSNAAQLGFPCLQHVTFAPIGEGLCVNAFYAKQYLIERAYGNYVGLCWLGRFAAHELGLPLVRMTCFTGIGECEIGKDKLAKLLAMVNGVSQTELQLGVKP